MADYDWDIGDGSFHPSGGILPTPGEREARRVDERVSALEARVKELESHFEEFPNDDTLPYVVSVKELFENTDAMFWAENLARVIENGAEPDAGLLVGWFANYAAALEFKNG